MSSTKLSPVLPNLGNIQISLKNEERVKTLISFLPYLSKFLDKETTKKLQTMKFVSSRALMEIYILCSQLKEMEKTTQSIGECLSDTQDDESQFIAATTAKTTADLVYKQLTERTKNYPIVPTDLFDDEDDEDDEDYEDDVEEDEDDEEEDVEEDENDEEDEDDEEEDDEEEEGEDEDEDDGEEDDDEEEEIEEIDDEEQFEEEDEEGEIEQFEEEEEDEIEQFEEDITDEVVIPSIHPMYPSAGGEIIVDESEPVEDAEKIVWVQNTQTTFQKPY